MRRHPPPVELTDAVLCRVPWLRRRLLDWFESHGRHFPWREPGRTPYEVLVAEILLQRTPASTVSQIYSSLIARFPTPATLAKASEDELQTVLKPLGLWRLRAKVLRAGAVMIDSLGSSPIDITKVEEIKGVGQYTANAVAMVVYGHEEALLDANMARVLERYFGPRHYADIRDDPYLQTLARHVVRGADCLKVNWAILDLGALVCIAGRPRCERCPVADHCRAREISRSEEGGNGTNNVHNAFNWSARRLVQEAVRTDRCVDASKGSDESV